MNEKGENTEMNEHDELLAEFKSLQTQIDNLEEEIKYKVKKIIDSGNITLLNELGDSLEKLSGMPMFSAGSDMKKAAQNIIDTPTEEEKEKLISIGKELEKQLKAIYYAEGWVSFESELTICKRSVVLNVKIGDKECEDDRGVYTRPEFEGDITIKKTRITIEEYENTPDGISNRRDIYCSTDISAKAIVDHFEERLRLPKKESYNQSYADSRTVEPRKD